MGQIFATFSDSFNIYCPVIKWDEGFNAIPTNNYNKRNLSFSELQNTITQFTVHWSVTKTAKATFNGLNARHLSCNFIIDDNQNDEHYATVYQTLPVLYGGWSQGGAHNNLGAGVEISFMPNAWEQNIYTSGHETINADIHGQKLKVYLPSVAQTNSLIELIYGVCSLFPKIKPEFPKDSSGKYITTKLENVKEWCGLLNHYNIDRGKIDTAGLDLLHIETEVKKRLLLGF